MVGRLYPQELVLPRLLLNYAPITCKQLVHMATPYKENEMPTNLAALCARNVRKCQSFRKLNWGNVWQQLTHCTTHRTVNTRSSGHTSHRSLLHTACLQILSPPAGLHHGNCTQIRNIRAHMQLNVLAGNMPQLLYPNHLAEK